MKLFEKFRRKCFLHDLQIKLKLLIPAEMGHDVDFYFYLHNKGQMYFPRQDETFGSFHLLKTMTVRHWTTYSQRFRLEQTHWKTLDTENQRCEDQNAEGNTAACITEYLEQTVGCSMDLYGSDPGIERYQ